MRNIITLDRLFIQTKILLNKRILILRRDKHLVYKNKKTHKCEY